MVKRAIARVIAMVVAVAVLVWLLARPLRPRLSAFVEDLASDWRVYVLAFIVSVIAYGITRRNRLHPTEPRRLSTAERVPVDVGLEEGR